MISPFSLSAPSTRRILSFAKVIVTRGHKVTIVLPCLDRYSSFKVEETSSSDGVNLSYPFQFKTLNSAVNLLPYTLTSSLSVISRKFDVIHVLKPTPITASAYIAKNLSKTPIVQDIDDLDHVVMAAERHSSAATWITARCEKVLPTLANHIVVSCSALTNFYSYITPGRVTEISNGVFIKDFQFAEKDETLKDYYGLSEKVIVYVGSLNNKSQLHPLLLSMSKIVSLRKDVTCLIVGDGNAKQDLQKTCYDLKINNCVKFTGRVPYSLVPKLMAISNIGFACFPSLDYLNYVSNIKVFEYMAAGLPVIVSPMGDLPFYVNYGKAGVISSSEPDQLSSKLIELLNNERRLGELAENAKQYVKNFDWSILSEKLLKVYSEVSS